MKGKRLREKEWTKEGMSEGERDNVGGGLKKNKSSI